MKTPLLSLTALLSGLAAAVLVSPVLASPVGVLDTRVFAVERDAHIPLVVWYPAVGGSEQSGSHALVGENGLFYGAPAMRDADIAKGRYPLILISHGGGGNGAQFGWLANALVARGFVVAAPNHPGSTSGNSSAKEAVKLWLRASDLSAALDGLAADEQLLSVLDMQRVGVFGFSAGGYSALAVAGARVDQQALTSFCDEGSKGMSDCAFLRRGGVDLHQMDLSLSGRSNTDTRVAAVMAVDPGIAPILTPDSLSSISIPVALLNMGEAEQVPYAVDASAAANLIEGVSFSRIEDGNHFSLLPRCKPAAPFILEEEGELDPLCDDVVGGRARAEIHQQLEQQVGDFFSHALSAQ